MVNLFIKVPMDKAVSVVQDKMESDLELSEQNSNLITNLIEMWTFFWQTPIVFWYKYQQEEGMAIISSDGEHIQGVFWRNGVNTIHAKQLTEIHSGLTRKMC